MPTPVLSLFRCIDRGVTAQVQKAIAQGANLTRVNAQGDTPLMHAVRLKRVGAAAALLEAGADLNERIRLSGLMRAILPSRIKFETPLSIAIVNADLPMIELLLSKGASLSTPECEGAIGYLLFFGSKPGRRAVMFLLDHGLDPKMRISGAPLYRKVEKYEELRNKLESLGEKMRPLPKRPPRKLPPPNPKSRNASDFISFVHDWGRPEWIVLAVEAPLHPVSEQYASNHKAPAPLKSVPIRSARKHDDAMTGLVPIVRVKGYPWSVTLHALCVPLGSSDFQKAEQSCRKLSLQLKTRSAFFYGVETSYAMGYMVYRNGNKELAYAWDSQNSSADTEFEDLGIYLPCCFPRQERGQTLLCVTDSNRVEIEAADVIRIER
jgi:hypothetical protein